MPRQRTGILVIGALLAASGVAFLRAEQLKLQHSPIGATRVQKYFSTVCPVRPGTRCRSHSARISFRLRSAGTVALAIASSSGTIVDRLTPAAGTHMRHGRVTVRWDGHTATGTTAADGTYHLRVDLISLDRVITVTDPIQLDDTPPQVALQSRRGALPIRYRTSEPAVVFVHATAIGAHSGGALYRGHDGRVHFRHTRLSGDEVRITLVAVDPAGNASPPLAAGSVRLPG